MKYFFITILLIFAVSTTTASNACNCSTVVTFQPGGTTSGTTFSDFGDLCSYIASVSSTEASSDRWTIQIDGSFTGGSPSIATGTYSLPSSVEFIGLASSDNPG